MAGECATAYNLEKVQKKNIVSKSLQINDYEIINMSVKKIDNGYILKYEVYDCISDVSKEPKFKNELFSKKIPSILIEYTE